jgi:hypothetical protein
MVEQKELAHIQISVKNTLAYFGQHSDNVSILKKFFVTDGGAKGVRRCFQISVYPKNKISEKHSSLLWSTN